MGDLSHIPVKARVWWEPTKDPDRTDYSGAWWPATVLRRNVTSQQVQLQYDNGSVEWTKAAFVSPPDCGCDFGKEDFPLQVVRTSPRHIRIGRSHSPDPVGIDDELAGVVRIGLGHLPHRRDGEFVEESNDSPTDPCAWLGKVSRTIVSGQSYMRGPPTSRCAPATPHQAHRRSTERGQLSGRRPHDRRRSLQHAVPAPVAQLPRDECCTAPHPRRATPASEAAWPDSCDPRDRTTPHNKGGPGAATCAVPGQSYAAGLESVPEHPWAPAAAPLRRRAPQHLHRSGEGTLRIEYPFHDTIPEEINGSLLRRARVFRNGAWMNVRPHFSWAPGRVTNPLDLDLISEDDLWVYIKEQLEANLQNMRAAMGVPLPTPTAPSPAPGSTAAARPQPFPHQQHQHQQHQPAQLPTLNPQQASTSSQQQQQQQQQRAQPRLSVAAAAAAAGMVSARGAAPLTSVAAAAAAAGRAGGASLPLGASPNGGGGHAQHAGLAASPSVLMAASLLRFAQQNPQLQQPQRLQPQRLQPLQQAQPLQFPQQLLPQLRLNAGLSHAEVQRAKFAALGKLGNAAKARLAAAEEQRGAAAVAHTLTQIGAPGGLSQLNPQRANATLTKQRAHAAAMLRAAPRPRDGSSVGGAAAAADDDDDVDGGDGGGGVEGREAEEGEQEESDESDEEEAYAQPRHHGGGGGGRARLRGSDGAGGDPGSSTQGRYLQCRWFHEFRHLRSMTVDGEERLLCSCCTLYNGQTVIAPKGDSIRKHMRTARHLKADAAFPLGHPSHLQEYAWEQPRPRLEKPCYTGPPRPVGRPRKTPLPPAREAGSTLHALSRDILEGESASDDDYDGSEHITRRGGRHDGRGGDGSGSGSDDGSSGSGSESGSGSGSGSDEDDGEEAETSPGGRDGHAEGGGGVGVGGREGLAGKRKERGKVGEHGGGGKGGEGLKRAADGKFAGGGSTNETGGAATKRNKRRRLAAEAAGKGPGVKPASTAWTVFLERHSAQIMAVLPPGMTQQSVQKALGEAYRGLEDVERASLQQEAALDRARFERDAQAYHAAAAARAAAAVMARRAAGGRRDLERQRRRGPGGGGGGGGGAGPSRWGRGGEGGLRGPEARPMHVVTYAVVIGSCPGNGGGPAAAAAAAAAGDLWRAVEDNRGNSQHHET
ncbi:MAG: hypothetical protein WDW36_000097 [Sanguina aurantia]